MRSASRDFRDHPNPRRRQWRRRNRKPAAGTTGCQRRAVMTVGNRDNTAAVAAAFQEMLPRRSSTATATAARTIY